MANGRCQMANQMGDGRTGVTESDPILSNAAFQRPSAMSHRPSAMSHLPSGICHLPSSRSGQRRGADGQAFELGVAADLVEIRLLGDLGA